MQGFCVCRESCVILLAMEHKHNITAIIYDKRGRPLSIGQNSYTRTHPRQAALAAKVGLPEKKFVHAEFVAITKCRDLSKAHKIVIMRYTKDGKPANAKPCAICQAAIALTPIKIIEHT